MAQRIEDKTILVLDRSEFQALNRLLYGLYENSKTIDALFEVSDGNIMLDPNDREALLGMWGSIHNILPDPSLRPANH